MCLQVDIKMCCSIIREGERESFVYVARDVVVVFWLLTSKMAFEEREERREEKEKVMSE